jgi:hypothetical protein
MSVALKKSDGDLFINDAGRGEEVSGPTKVDQELFSLYTTEYDPARRWGSKLHPKFFKEMPSPAHLRAAVFSEVNAANDRIIKKQERDTYLDTEKELIRDFNYVDVFVDPSSLNVLFYSSASVGDPATEVGRQLVLSYKPISTRHVIPPPFPTGIVKKKV